VPIRDVVVVGAGVVGLAFARAYAATGRDVAIVERHPSAGREQSTHNSGVVHSGAFARPGTLRAALNVAGARLLVREAEALGVAVEPGGTLVVAARRSDLPRLSEYHRWATQNGVPDVRFLSSAEAQDVEPHLGPCERALLAPTGGRVDAAGLVRALDLDLERAGVERRFDFEVVRASRAKDVWTLHSRRGAVVEGRTVVNSAGVGAARLAEHLGAPGHRVYPCLGEYARVTGERRDWVRSMIYGFPPAGYPGIGVHLTRTTAGDLLIGPTATYLDSPVAPALPITPLATFAELASAYVPGISERDLEVVAPGIRAKTVPPESGEPFGEFEIVEEPLGTGAIHLFGIESPGLTASFAIARHVVDRWPADRP
jgi:glycerol-3-phosphate dehydrogenase